MKRALAHYRRRQISAMLAADGRLQDDRGRGAARGEPGRLASEASARGRRRQT